MACLSLNLYYTPGIAPRMNVLFWVPGDFPVSYSNRDTSWNAWNHSWRVRLAKQETLTPPGHLVSPLVWRGPWMSTVVLYCWCHSDSASVLLYFTFRKFYGRYGDLIHQYEVSLSRIDILFLDQQWLPNQSVFPPISWLYTELDLHRFWVVSMEHLQRVWHASRERLPFRTPGSVPHCWTCLCSNCWDQIPRTCHVFTRLFTSNTPWYFPDFACLCIDKCLARCMIKYDKIGLTIVKKLMNYWRAILNTLFQVYRYVIYSLTCYWLT